MRSRTLRVVTILVVLLLVAATAVQLIVAKPGPHCRDPRPGCFCPDYYAPVVCDGNCVYSNKCFAACAGAKNCVPYGPF